MSAMHEAPTLYAHTDHALWRIFAQQERGTGTHPLGRLVQSGYRVSGLGHTDGSTRETRLADDSRTRTRLRHSLDKTHFSLLVLRYSPDLSDIQRHWPEVAQGFRDESRLTKTLRSNPVMLRLFMVWSLRHPDLRQHQLAFNGHRRTQYRWMNACERVADDAWSRAEQQAEAALRHWGLIP